MSAEDRAGMREECHDQIAKGWLASNARKMLDLLDALDAKDAEIEILRGLLGHRERTIRNLRAKLATNPSDETTSVRLADGHEGVRRSKAAKKQAQGHQGVGGEGL